MPLTFQAGAVLEMLMFCKQRVAVRAVRMSMQRAVAPVGFCCFFRPNGQTPACRGFTSPPLPPGHFMNLARTERATSWLSKPSPNPVKERGTGESQSRPWPCSYIPRTWVPILASPPTLSLEIQDSRPSVKGMAPRTDWRVSISVLG